MDLWNENFKMIELNEIMRQREDVEFAQLLNKIRNKSKHEQIDENEKKYFLKYLKHKIVALLILCISFQETKMSINTTWMLSTKKSVE